MTKSNITLLLGHLQEFPFLNKKKIKLVKPGHELSDLDPSDLDLGPINQNATPGTYIVGSFIHNKLRF